MKYGTLKKIDIHVHTMMYPEISFPRGDGSNYATPEELMTMYDAWGIERGCLLPEITNECCLTASTSEEVCMISRKYPDRFYWFCNLTPLMGGNSAHYDFGPILEHYKKLGAKGVGEVCYNLPFDCPMSDNLLRCCAEHDMPIIIHIGATLGNTYGVYDDFGLPRIENMLKKYPQLRVIGHSQCFWAELSGDITEDKRNLYPAGPVSEGRIHALLRAYPNLYCDLSAGSGCNAMLRDEDHAFRFLEEFKDRVMFGTDICSPKNYFPLSKWLDEKHADGCIPDDVYYQVCRGNAIRELKLPLDF